MGRPPDSKAWRPALSAARPCGGGRPSWFSGTAAPNSKVAQRRGGPAFPQGDEHYVRSRVAVYASASSDSPGGRGEGAPQKEAPQGLLQAAQGTMQRFAELAAQFMPMVGLFFLLVSVYGRLQGEKRVVMVEHHAMCFVAEGASLPFMTIVAVAAYT